jgi:two-component system, chemotaxis family, CheB/CheR fusion protein
MADELSIAELIHILAEERGLDLRGYKHSTLDRRIHKRMAELNIRSIAEYVQRIRGDEEETNALLTTVLINVTEFFRDPAAWQVLRDSVLPQFLRRLRPGDIFRAWSAGCASGEETYSLAILMADVLGPKLGDYNIKIYATDIDEDALATARAGEYPAERLRRVPPELRERFFYGKRTLRVTREVRQLVIFGRGNLVSDAPISHCNMVVCRNVLIYFNTEAQRHIFKRLHYALEPGGILFLGKSESKLTESKYFRSVNPRWRIFERMTEHSGRPEVKDSTRFDTAMSDDGKVTQELRILRLQQSALLETLKPGVMIMDSSDVIVSHNEPSVALWGVPGLRLAGKKLDDTELVARCQDLPAYLETSKAGIKEVDFECRLRLSGEDRLIQVTLKPMLSEAGERYGTVIYSENISSHEKLRHTAEERDTAGEELQSANEELETTNEELQSTNEELETTNEELQSTNEELETTNEELQSLNEELENMNDELERRTRELNELTVRYGETLRGMPWPVLMVDREERIQLWNTAAQRLFGVGATSVVGVRIDQLPISSKLRTSIVRKYRSVLANRKAMVLRNEEFETQKIKGTFDLHFTPIGRDSGQLDGVLVMFGPRNPETTVALAGRSRPMSTNNNKPAAKRAGNSRPKKAVNPARPSKRPNRSNS